MLTKSRLKEIFRQNDFTPLKRFGENYLVDANIVRKFMEALALSGRESVIEIGPGFGMLTSVIAANAGRVAAVEKDKKAYSILREVMLEEFSNLEIINGDILEFNIKRFAAGEKVKVAGSLPYYITTPILELLIENRTHISVAALIVQKEVARRLCALPGSKEYGSITCFVKYSCEVSYIHTVKRGCFYPEPDVDSSIIKLTMLKDPSVLVENEKLLFKIVRGSFGQRRKTITNSLARKEVLDMPKTEVKAVLKLCGIPTDSRPEQLSLEQFAKITNAFS